MRNPFGKLTYGNLKKVTGHCYIFRNVVNSGVIITPEGVVVVDTQINAPMARRMLEAIRKLTDAPIRYVINTHYHWDHWSGNAVFKQAGATIVSGELTREFMHGRHHRQRAFLRSRGFAIPPDDPVLADQTFDKEMTLQLGSLPIHILHLGRAETDDANAVYLPTENCVISGDTLMTGSFPILGQPVMVEGLSDDRSWIKALEKMKALGPEVIIPGHGPVGGIPEIDFFIGLQAYFLNEVIPLVNEEVPLEEIIRRIESGLPEKYASLPQVWGTSRYAVLRIVRNMVGWQEMKPSAVPTVDPEVLQVPLSEMDDQPESFIRAAEFFEGENRLDLAIGLIDEGCQRHPKESALWVSRGRIYLKCSRSAGSVLERADFFAEVCGSAEKALKIDPGYVPALILLGSYHAMGAFRNGDDPAEAMQLLGQALERALEPGDEARAHFSMGLCYRALEQEEQAITHFNRALELDPQHAPARMALMEDGEIRMPDRFVRGAKPSF